MFKNRKNTVFYQFTKKIQKQLSLKNSQILQEKPDLESVFKIVTCRRCFHANFAEFSRTPVLQNICKRLVMKIVFIQIQLHNTWQNLLKQFTQISPTNFVMLFLIRKYYKRKQQFFKKANSLVGLVFFTQKARCLDITLIL